MNFDESENYLYSLGNEVSAMKLGLGNITKLLAALGDPQYKFKKVQVAGTNGKGSVCAFLDAICLEAGTRTGRFTSPHLISITERVKIAGEDIREDDFARHSARVRETSERLVGEGVLESVPTYFEQVTAVALTAFAEANVELAIIETGLGGRYDATTAASAEFAAITRIDLDHQEYLGNTLAEIAAEKAAIIRSDSKVVIGEQTPEAMEIIDTVCSGFGIIPKAAKDVAVLVRTESGSDRVPNASSTHSLPVVFPPDLIVSLGTHKALYENAALGLAGRHQFENAKVAVLLAELLREQFGISAKNIIDGLEAARHPGRLEISGQFLFDGAHNTGGAKALRVYLDEVAREPITVIFGSMNGKDIAGMAESIFPIADLLVLTCPQNSRAMRAEDIANFVPKEFDRAKLVLTENVEQALDIARQKAGDGLILVTGSLYLVGEVQKILKMQRQSVGL